MTYEDIAARERLSQNIGQNLAGIGQGYAETAIAKYRMAMDQRRMQREDESHAQKQRVDQQERRRERAGARLTGILASGQPTEQMYRQIQALQEEFKNIDLAGTDAGRGMFGAYGMLGRRSIGAADRPLPGAMTPVEELEAKYRKAKAAAVNADDAESVEFWDRKLAEVKQGTIPLTEAELQGGMSDLVAASEASGRKIREAAVIEPTKSEDQKYADLLSGAWGDVSGGAIDLEDPAAPSTKIRGFTKGGAASSVPLGSLSMALDRGFRISPDAGIITAFNPETKKRIYSRDGGQTWQPLR